MSTYAMYLHLNGRDLDTTLYPSLSIGDETVTFPLWNLCGQWVGYQQYRPSGSKQYRRDPREGKYFTYINKLNPITAWGLELLNPVDKTIYLVEGIFKACRFHNYGYNALATLSNNPKHLIQWLRCLGYTIHTVCDGDKAGRKLAKYGSNNTFLKEGEYIDEMSGDEFRYLLYRRLINN